MQLIVSINVFFTFVVFCFISESPPFSIQNTDLQIVQNIFPTSSVSFKKENCDFKFGVSTSFCHFLEHIIIESYMINIVFS